MGLILFITKMTNQYKFMDHSHESGISNIKLMICALIFKMAAEFTLSEFLDNLLTSLSILSVMLIIIINWKKAMNVLFKTKNEDENIH